MPDIIKNYTAEQLSNFYRNKIISDDVGLTDFNEGSKTQSIIDSNSEIVSSIAMDFKEGLVKAIPTALYEGLGFSKKPAASAIGFIRPYRVPVMTVNYTGAGTSAVINSDASTFSASVTGAVSDNFSFDYASYPTTNNLVEAINALTNWTAAVINNASTVEIFQYTSKEIIGSKNYKYQDGLDIALTSDTEIIIPEGYSVTIDDIEVLTTSENTLLAGETGVQCAARVVLPGLDGNLKVNAIDTFEGKGYINSVIEGISYAINDSSFSGGRLEETEIERAQRFIETINGLNAGTRLGIISAIKAIPDVRSADLLPATPTKGTNTILVDDGTGFLSAELQAEIEKILEGDPDDIVNYPGKEAYGMDYPITVPTLIDVNIGVAITRLPSIDVDLDEIKIDVQSAIEQYINTQKIGADVLVSEIIRVSKNSNAAVYDITVNTPSDTISIAGSERAQTGVGTGGTVSVTASIATSI